MSTLAWSVEAMFLLIGVMALLLGGVALGVTAWLLRRRRDTSDAAHALRHEVSATLNTLQGHLGELQERVSGQVRDSLQSARVEQRDGLAAAVKALEARFANLSGQVDSKLHQTVQANRADMAQVTERLTRLHEATGQIVSLSKGVHDLHALLRSPAGRGSFGEWSLERLLEEVLGREGRVYRRQHTLADGQRVDVAVFTRPRGEQVVCVDAKFPATAAQLLVDATVTGAARDAARKQFVSDVRGHARQIADKYIRPPETLDFAFIYVPSEALFQLVMEQTELHEHLLGLRVVPTSPNSFHAYLQVLAYGLRSVQIEAAAREIQKHVAGVGRDLATLQRSVQTLGNHLRNAGSKHEEVNGDLRRLSERIDHMIALGEPADIDADADAESATGLRMAGS